MKKLLLLISISATLDSALSKSVRGRDLLPQPGECGVQSSDRIVGGGLTSIYEFPWLGLLEYEKTSGGSGFACGGSLINSRYVLTAAHCIDIGRDWRLSSVRFGEWDLQSDVDCNEDGECADPPVNVRVERVIPHGWYDPQDPNSFNDIALLRLAQPVNFTYFITPICLPTQAKFKVGKIDYGNTGFDVSGWGKTEFKTKSRYKLAVQVPYQSQEDCGAIWGSITSKQICAGGVKGKDSCGGDSGGPLMDRSKTSDGIPYQYLVGIVSYGTGECGTKDVPGVYTRVSEYINWIESKLEP